MTDERFFLEPITKNPKAPINLTSALRYLWGECQEFVRIVEAKELSTTPGTGRPVYEAAAREYLKARGIILPAGEEIQVAALSIYLILRAQRKGENTRGREGDFETGEGRKTLERLLVGAEGGLELALKECPESFMVGKLQEVRDGLASISKSPFITLPREGMVLPSDLSIRIPLANVRASQEGSYTVRDR